MFKEAQRSSNVLLKMRKIAQVKNSEKVTRVMIYSASSNEAYQFIYEDEFDSGASADYYFDSPEAAIQSAEEDYDISSSDWVTIDEPMKHCQHDWISPIRVKGREVGKPQWGEYELLEDGNWIPFNLLSKNRIKPF